MRNGRGLAPAFLALRLSLVLAAGLCLPPPALGSAIVSPGTPATGADGTGDRSHPPLEFGSRVRVALASFHLACVPWVFHGRSVGFELILWPARGNPTPCAGHGFLPPWAVRSDLPPVGAPGP